MNKLLAISAAALLLVSCGQQKDNDKVNIEKQTIQLESDQMTPEIARYQYEIPLLFYVSDAFKANHPDLLGEIEAAQHKPFFATMLPFALFHLAGISHADYKSQFDILSPDFDESYPRIIREDVYYDELMKQSR